MALFLNKKLFFAITLEFRISQNGLIAAKCIGFVMMSPQCNEISSPEAPFHQLGEIGIEVIHSLVDYFLPFIDLLILNLFINDRIL